MPNLYPGTTVRRHILTVLGKWLTTSLAQGIRGARVTPAS